MATTWGRAYGYNGFEQQIVGMSSAFTSANYKSAGIAKSAVASDSTSISNVVQTIYPPSSGTDTGAPQLNTSKVTGYAAGTYTFYGWAQAANGKYYPAGSFSVTVVDPPKPKIDSFYTSNQGLDGELSVRCYWVISNWDSSTTAEIKGLSPANNQWYWKATVTSANSNALIEFSGAGTFTVRLLVYQNNTQVDSKDATAKPSLSVPESWSWTYNESYAFGNSGTITTLTQDRWNALIARANQCISFYNKAKKTNLTMIYDSEKMSDKILYASSFNSVVSKINTLCSYCGATGPSIGTVQKGDVIKGSYFTSLGNAVNNARTKLAAMS